MMGLLAFKKRCRNMEGIQSTVYCDFRLINHGMTGKLFRIHVL